MPIKKIVEDSYYSNSDTDSDDGLGSFSNPYPSKTACAKFCDKYKRQPKKTGHYTKQKKPKEVIVHIKHVKKMKMQVLNLEKEEEL